MMIKVHVGDFWRVVSTPQPFQELEYSKFLRLLDLTEEEVDVVFFYDSNDRVLLRSKDEFIYAASRWQNLDNLPKVYVKLKKDAQKSPPRREAKGPCFPNFQSTAPDGEDFLRDVFKNLKPFVQFGRCGFGAPHFVPKLLKLLKESDDFKSLQEALEKATASGQTPLDAFMEQKESPEFKRFIDKVRVELPELVPFLSMLGVSTDEAKNDESAKNSDEKNEEVHHGIVCDGCEQAPIKGPRFKCRDCPDFDLCTQCRFTTSHDETHAFDAVKPRPRFYGNRFVGRSFNGRTATTGFARAQESTTEASKDKAQVPEESETSSKGEKVNSDNGKVAANTSDDDYELVQDDKKEVTEDTKASETKVRDEKTDLEIIMEALNALDTDGRKELAKNLTK